MLVELPPKCMSKNYILNQLQFSVCGLANNDEPVSIMKEKGYMHASLESKSYDWDNRRSLRDQLTMQEILEPSSFSPALARGNAEFHNLF